MTTGRAPALSITGLHAGYGGTPVLRDVNLIVGHGEIVGVIGRNGAGKSTLMKAIIGLLTSTAGSVVHEGTDLTCLPANRRARQGIGYVPQGRGLFPRLSVRENLLMGELAARRPVADGYRLVHDLFPVLEERGSQLAGTMSGGQQQVLAIGRVLVGGPATILLDEPSEGIQPSIVQDIAARMLELNRRLGTTLVLVEQNIEMIRAMARRCYVMEKGSVAAELDVAQLADPVVVRRHLSV